MINYFNQTVLNRKRSVSIILTLFSNFLELRNVIARRNDEAIPRIYRQLLGLLRQSLRSFLAKTAKFMYFVIQDNLDILFKSDFL